MMSSIVAWPVPYRYLFSQPCDRCRKRARCDWFTFPARNFARTRASIRVCFKFGILSALMNFSGGTPTRNSTCKQKLLPFDYTTTTLARRIV